MTGPDPVANDATVKARWTRLATLGLFMVGLAAFLMIAASLIWGVDVADDLPFFLSLVIVPWVAAVLVWRFGTWAKVVGIVVALASIGAMFWTAFGLAAPASFFDFVPGLLVVPGALIAIVSSIGAIVAKRRGHGTPASEGGERRAITAVVAVVGLLAALSAVLTVVGRSTVDTPDGATTVALGNFEYDRSEYEVPGGSQVVVRNDDPFLHTFHGRRARHRRRARTQRIGAGRHPERLGDLCSVLPPAHDEPRGSWTRRHGGLAHRRLSRSPAASRVSTRLQNANRSRCAPSAGSRDERRARARSPHRRAPRGGEPSRRRHRARGASSRPSRSTRPRAATPPRSRSRPAPGASRHAAPRSRRACARSSSAAAAGR